VISRICNESSAAVEFTKQSPPLKIPAIKVMVLTEAEDDKLGLATHKTQKEFVVLNDLDTGHSKWLNWHFS